MGKRAEAIRCRYVGSIGRAAANSWARRSRIWAASVGSASAILTAGRVIAGGRDVVVRGGMVWAQLRLSSDYQCFWQIVGASTASVDQQGEIGLEMWSSGACREP